MFFLIIAFIRKPHNSSVLLWYKAAYLTQLSPSVLRAPQWKGKPDQTIPWSGKVAEMVVQLHLHNLIPICPHFVGCNVVVVSGCCCSSCCSLVAYFSFCFQFFLIMNWQASLSLRLYVTHWLAISAHTFSNWNDSCLRPDILPSDIKLWLCVSLTFAVPNYRVRS